MSLTLSPNGSLVSQLSQEEADTFLNTSASSAQPDQPYDGGLYGTPYALNAFASPQAKIVDALAPQMTSLSLNRSTFNVSYAYALITLTVGFTDDLSGISSAEISLIAPNGTIVTKDSIWMVNGSTLNGTISGQLIIPENAVHGSYSIKVTLYDAVGRSTTYETADDLFGVNLNVMAYPSDTLAPQIKSLSLSTTHVDVSNGYASVNVTVGFTDNLSGISYDGNSSIAVWLVGPDGKTVVTDSLYSPDGSTNDGTMSGTLRIPQYAQAGDYSITVLLRDVVGNTVRYEHADELFGLNFHASSSQTDTAAPRVTGLSLGQYEINVSGTSRDVDVAVSFSDNLSGVASATAWLIGPDGNVVAGNRLWDLSGTTLSGTMSGTLTVPRYAQTGDYSVKVALRDAVGNIITVANVDSNFGVNLHVSDQNDTQAPSLTSLTLSQSEVNVSGSEAQVEATVGYRDTLSGIGSARMWLVAPDGTKISEAEIWEWGGDEFNGTVTGVFTIPQNAPAGLYSVSVLLEDAPGNAIEYQHVGGPFDVNLVVLDEMNLPPVGSPTASLSSGAEDIAYSVKTTDLLKGFSDPNNDALTVTGLTSSTGTVVDNGNGTFTITPTANFNGTVKLTYSVADGDGGTLAGQTRSYVVAPVNDAPTAVQLSNASVREAAANGTVVGRLTGTDLDGPSLKYSLVDSAGGRFAIVGNELRVANGLMLDFEQSAGYTVRVSVTDSAGGTFARSIAVGVVNVSPESITGDAAANKLIGGVSNDTFSGLAGNDQLTGGAGNDRLNGGAGADVLLGQAGNDIYDVDNASDQVSEAGGSGLDLVQSSVSFSLSGAKVLGAVENLTLTGTAAINGTGNTLANAIVGNAAANSLYGAAGNDQLTGGAGNDRLNGGAGADVMLGQAGNDIYDVDNALDQVSEAGGSGLDLVQSSVSFSLSGAKALGDLENLTLTGTAAINGTGNALANAIVGNAAANSLDGGTGNDRLTGGAGNDRLIGGAGADVMLGQAGNDIYDVDNASDQVSEAGGSGLDLVQSSVSFSLSGAKVLGAVENLTLTGTAAINGTGNTLANAIVGNAAANSLDGGAGNDQITGGAGNDRLNGGAGADVLLGQAGNDIYDVDNALDQVSEAGGSGLDLVQSSVSFSLSGAKVLGAVENLTLTGTAAINGTGNTSANAIVGNAAANSLDGGAGNDQLIGGAGNDLLIGGAGLDTLTGSAGRDVFRFTTAPAATTVDKIVDFNVSDDTFQLENAVMAKLGAKTGVLAAAAFHKSAAGIAQDASDRIIYDTDNGRLYYDPDGTGAAKAILLATLSTKLALTAADFTVI